MSPSPSRAAGALATALAIAACGGPRPVPPEPPAAALPAAAVDAPPAAPMTAALDAAPVPIPLDRDLPALARRIAELYQAAATAAAAAGTDCARAAAGVNGVRADYREVRDAVARVVADGRQAQLEPELDQHADAFAAALRTLQPTLDACRTDAKLGAALDGLASGGQP